MTIIIVLHCVLLYNVSFHQFFPASSSPLYAIPIIPKAWSSYVSSCIQSRRMRTILPCLKRRESFYFTIFVRIGWLEPLLDRIARNESYVVCPVIDVIDDDTLRYQYSKAASTSIGGFDWNLQFSWHAIPDYLRKSRSSDVLPVP